MCGGSTTGALYAGPIGPNRKELIAGMSRQSAPFDRGRVPTPGRPEVARDNGAALVVVGVQPALDRLCGEATVRERADKRGAWPQHSGDVSKELNRSGQIVDRYTTDHGIKRVVRERQARVGVEVMDHRDGCLRIR